jgi:glycosyltransferase involved in cell wall biosynthesis
MSARPILQVITDNNLRGGQVFAADLHVALEATGESIRTVALAPGSGDRVLDFDVLGPSRLHVKTFRALRREMSRASVVVGHGSTTLPMCSMAGLGLATPFVYRQISEQRFWANTPGRRFRTSLALRAADHVTALWPGAAEVLISDFGVSPNHITIIPNGVPATRCPSVTSEERLEARARFGLNPERPTLLSLGAFAREKGVDVLVEAMRSPELALWQLLLVGAGPEREYLEQLASEVPTGSVIVHDPVSSGREAIAAADVIGLTSRGGDSMPAVLIEAGMMGIPAVATPVEGIVDIVLDGRTGKIVPVDNPAATASAARYVGERAAAFGSAAKEHCSTNFEIALVAERWHEVLDRLRDKQ